MNITELLVSSFEHIIGPLSISYANGQEWEDRRKWLYESLKGENLESCTPVFTKVSIKLMAVSYLQHETNLDKLLF